MCGSNFGLNYGDYSNYGNQYNDFGYNSFGSGSSFGSSISSYNDLFSSILSECQPQLSACDANLSNLEAMIRADNMQYSQMQAQMIMQQCQPYQPYMANQMPLSMPTPMTMPMIPQCQPGTAQPMPVLPQQNQPGFIVGFGQITYGEQQPQSAQGNDSSSEQTPAVQIQGFINLDLARNLVNNSYMLVVGFGTIKPEEPAQPDCTNQGNSAENALYQAIREAGELLSQQDDEATCPYAEETPDSTEQRLLDLIEKNKLAEKNAIEDNTGCGCRDNAGKLISPEKTVQTDEETPVISTEDTAEPEAQPNATEQETVQPPAQNDEANATEQETAQPPVQNDEPDTADEKPQTTKVELPKKSRWQSFKEYTGAAVGGFTGYYKDKFRGTEGVTDAAGRTCGIFGDSAKIIIGKPLN